MSNDQHLSVSHFQNHLADELYITPLGVLDKTINTVETAVLPGLTGACYEMSCGTTHCESQKSLAEAWQNLLHVAVQPSSPMARALPVCLCAIILTRISYDFLS